MDKTPKNQHVTSTTTAGDSFTTVATECIDGRIVNGTDIDGNFTYRLCDFTEKSQGQIWQIVAIGAAILVILLITFLGIVFYRNYVQSSYPSAMSTFSATKKQPIAIPQESIDSFDTIYEGGEMGEIEKEDNKE